MKKIFLLISILCNLLITATEKTTYTYNLVQTSPKTVIEEQKHYAYPGTTYQFIFNIANYNGFAIGDFDLELTNGKFEDGKTTKRVQNATPILVNWKDTSNVNAKNKISLATPNDTANVILKKALEKYLITKSPL
jgi:hypothetical protein